MIESGAIKEGTRSNREGVIVVDSIEDFMRENNAIRLEDLDKHINESCLNESTNEQIMEVDNIW